MKARSSSAYFLATLFFVNTLHPFSNENSNFKINGNADLTNSILQFDFILKDDFQQFSQPQVSRTWSNDQIDRQLGLWNHTCFEAFLKPVGTDKYYEFNFSLKPAWMAFLFESYRFPQPPMVTNDFHMQSMNWDLATGTLTVQLLNTTQYNKFNIGLTAILEEKSGIKHYYALAHMGTKPDFHLSESFTLIRG